MTGAQTFLVGILAVLLVIPVAALAGESLPSDIGQIVVTARQVEESVRTTAHTVLTVTGEEIDRRVDRSVGESLRELPGLVVESLGTRGESLNVRIRGGTNGDTLVLLDGVRLNNPATNETNLSLIPVDQIDRIEVLEGSQAVLYGGSAVGGVINIISKKGGDQNQVSLSTEFGNMGHTREFLNFNGSKGITRFNLGFSRTDDSGQFDNDTFRETAISQRWDLNPMEGMTLTLTSRIFISSKGLARAFLVGPAPLYDPSLPPDAAFLQLDLDNNRNQGRLLNTQSLKLSYDWNQTYRTEFLYGFLLSNDTEDDSNIGNPGFTTPSGLVLAPNSVRNKMDSMRNSADLRQFFFIPQLGEVSQTVMVGFEFYDERVKQSGVPFPGDPPPPPGSIGPFIPPIDTIPAPGISGVRQNYAPYMLYHLAFKERLFFDGGFRWDQNSAYGGELSPRLAVAVKIPEVDGKFHAVYGEGFLPPTPLQLFNPISGNPNLQPQTSQSYEAGYTQWFGDKASLYATYFFMDFDNLIDRLGQNINDAFSTGLETGFWVKPIPQFKIGANYTYNHSKDESGGGGGIPNVPTHVFNATVSANPWRSLTIDSTLSVVGNSRQNFPLVSTDGRFVGGTPAASLAGGFNDGYALWDMSVSYTLDLDQPHPRALKLFGKAANILNEDIEITFGFPYPGFYFITGAEVLF